MVDSSYLVWCWDGPLSVLACCEGGLPRQVFAGLPWCGREHILWQWGRSGEPVLSLRQEGQGSGPSCCLAPPQSSSPPHLALPVPFRLSSEFGSSLENRRFDTACPVHFSSLRVAEMAAQQEVLPQDAQAIVEVLKSMVRADRQPPAQRSCSPLCHSALAPDVPPPRS